MANNSNVLRFPSPIVPSDAQEREQALDIQRSWIVEAPAGSGKTGLLMQRFLKLLAEPGVGQPEDILAITFTRKATAELRDRIVEQLREARDGKAIAAENTFQQMTRGFAQAALARDAEAGWGVLDRPQRLNIRTIDSVCGEIASTLPLLSGMGAPRTPTEDAKPLYRTAARRTLMQLGGKNARLSEAIRDVLLHRDGSLPNVEELLSRMLATREQWAELVPLGEELEDETLERVVRPRLERAVEQAVCAALNHALRAIPGDFLQALAWFAARYSNAPGYNGAVSPIAFCAGRPNPPAAEAEQLEHWKALIDLVVKKDGDWRSGFNVNHVGFSLTKDEKKLLTEMVDEVRHDEALCKMLCAIRDLPPPRYPEDQWAVAKSLFRLLYRALAELKVLFAERNECDFAELSMAAKQALRPESSAAELSRASGFTLRHLLVDEMQDTSASQYELMQLLTRTWDGHSQTLFLVGDPKQSIYLFRQARVERFLRTMQEKRLGDIELGVLRLTTNFRSNAELVNGFNASFREVFPMREVDQTGSMGVDVPFVEASAAREGGALEGPALNWHATVLEPMPKSPYPDAEQRRKKDEEEAREVRCIIEQWRERSVGRVDRQGRKKPWTVAVLVRGRSQLQRILPELLRVDERGLSIPFRARDIEALGLRPEVGDVLALTRALVHPADRVAWLAVFRAPWCGLDRADLLALAGGGAPEAGREPLPVRLEERRELLSAEGQKLFARAWPVLRSALVHRGRMPAATLVERTWRSLGGDLYLAANERENVRLFLRALGKNEEAEGQVDTRALTANLNELYAEPRIVAEGEFVVDITTIHKSKGLEWDVVLVPGLGRAGKNNNAELLNWLELDSRESDAAEIVLAPIHSMGSEPGTLYTWVKGVRNARDAAERKRLFYVASTRAKEELHLFGTAIHGKDGVKPLRNTLLQAAWDAAYPYFEAALEEMQPAGAGALEIPAAEEEMLQLAAGAESPKAKPVVIERLPLSVVPAEHFASRDGAPSLLLTTLNAAVGKEFERPEGSYGVRAFGNVVHRFLEYLAQRLAKPGDWQTLREELPGWLPRITASLRAEGLAPAAIGRQAERTLEALTRALEDEIGRWLLSPHPGAGTEQAMRLPGARELRVDRIFLAGPEPLSSGDSHLWIVDFKTTDQGALSNEYFARQEQAKYGPQLALYAEALQSLHAAPRAVRQGLYYPALPKLMNW